MTSIRNPLLLFLAIALVRAASTGVKSLSAELKPLTPIAGTNLFLNTPYKWHDITKRGCFVTWFNEKYQDFAGQHKGVSIVCNANDQTWYDTTDADWIFERTHGDESIDEYAGTVKIFNVGGRDTLETWLSAGTWWVGVASYGANPDEDMWNVRSDATDKNRLQLDIQDWYLAQHPTKNHRAFLFLEHGNKAGFPYSFVPAISLEAKMYNFEFVRPIEEELGMHTSQKKLAEISYIENNSSSEVSKLFKVSEKVTDEFSWGLSQSLKIFAKVSGSVGIPFLAEGEVETGFEAELAANQNWKKSVEKTIELSYEVKVPQYTRVEISSFYDLIDGLRMDYTATAEVTGKSGRVTIFNDIVGDEPSTGSMIQNHLNYSKFDGEIVTVKENSVIVRVKGTLTASVGVRGRLSINGVTVAKSDN